MGQSASIETPSTVSQPQLSNVLPGDGAASMRVQCLEISNGTLEKLQGVLRDGCDAAALAALPCQTVNTTAAATIGELCASLSPAGATAETAPAEAKPLYLFAVRKVSDVATATTEEEANGLIPIPASMTIRDVLCCPGIVTFVDDADEVNLLLLYSPDATLGNDMMGLCCIVALIAACCACCVGLCCCGAAAMKGDKQKPTQSNNYNTNNGGRYNQNQGNNNNYGNTNNNYMADPNYGTKPTNNYGLPPNQGPQGQPGQQYQNNGYTNNNNNYGYQQQPTTGQTGNPLQPAPL